MEDFYELLMRNGSTFIVSTNKEGVCEFSIGEKEFIIQIIQDGKGERISFSFSVAEPRDLDGFTCREGYSVISVKKVNSRSLRALDQRNKGVRKSVVERSAGRWSARSSQKEVSFCAHKGSINTPASWLCA